MSALPVDFPAALRTEYPFSPQSFTTPAGAVMRYLDEGPRSDSAVLMLHGNPTWSCYYRHLSQTLSGSRRCIAPDHIGMGLSAKPQDYDYSLARRIDDVAALVRMLGLRQIDLVVHDWGGAIGFGLAARHPELIGRLTVLNTAAFASPNIPRRIALCRTPVLGPLVIRGLNGFAGPAVTMSMHRRRLSAVERRGYLWPYRNWADRVAVNAFVQDIPLAPDHRTWPVLSAVEKGIPALRDREALIVWGGRDFCFDDTFLARWQRELPQARVHRIADAGHYVLDDARDEVLPLLAAHLSGKRP
jgi:pimeloyl-ACP methyl ester carboxylesterase